MSWNGFKKKINRVGIMLKQTAGMVGKTEDKTFNAAERRFKIYEKKITTLCNETKEYLNCVRALTLQEYKVAEELDGLYNETFDMALCAMNLKTATGKINDSVRLEFDNNYIKCVLDPVNQLGVNFPTVNQLISKRENKLLDYDECKSKVDKLVEKPSNDPTNLTRAEDRLNKAKEIYETINQELIEYLPKPLNNRVQYLEPTFDALILSQLSFAEKSFNTLNDLQNKFLIAGANLDSLDNLTEKSNFSLQELKKLGICNFSQ
ncbi:BAR-domain-containing protein [Anaeromyces robustus]|uniref:BAR-domain-containing protein n=1 Tax=Anaeromyces robustus TaxID=1754192 RepID=A0A1Y1VRD9_9FUNG|nr:BAR-domain-containing protein [Anaeromyces robustus]|eukprot:ORX63862.1 BAR-domain-containing protein [Anaeromyces robustus]